MARSKLGLTAKERAFCDEYVKTYNAGQAYMAVYDCKLNTALSDGYKMLKRPAIINYIKELQQALTERYVDAAAIILNELMEDIVYRDADNNHSPTWLKSVDLVQKQLGLQKLKADIQAEHTIINVNIDET